MSAWISVEDVFVDESDGHVQVVVRLSEPALQTVTVAYRTVEETASDNGYDYVAVQGTLSFVPGETVKAVLVPLSEYQGREQTEYFRFELSSATNATISRASALVSIYDDDTVANPPQIFMRDVTVDEKAGIASFVVWMDAASNSTVTVDYATANGSASSGGDYATTAGTLSFSPGEVVKTVAVDIVDDVAAEGVERFFLNLSNAVNANIADASAVGQIGANDAAAVLAPQLSIADQVVGESDGFVDVVVRLSSPGTQPVSVRYTTVDGTADDNHYDYMDTAGVLNFAVGETVKTVRIPLSEYSGVEELEHFRLELSAATNATIERGSALILILDDDTISPSPQLFVRDVTVDEKAGMASFIVWMDAASESTVTVDYATASGAALAGSDFVANSGTLSFAAGETVKTVVVDIVDDAAVEGVERFALNLSNAVNASIRDASAVGEIGVNDAAVVLSPRLSVFDQVVGESDGYIDVAVRLSAPSNQAISVSYSTADMTADDNNYDYLGVSGILNFAMGETVKTVRIPISEYSGVEELEHFRLELSAATNATIARGSALISIVDNDTISPSPQLFVRDVTVDEKAGTASFVVLMDAASDSTVTVDYSTVEGTALAGSDFVANSGALSFAAGETVKTVVVDIVDDAAVEGVERFALSLTNAVNASIGDGLAAGIIGRSDESATNAPQLGVSDHAIAEGEGYVDVHVTLDAPSSQNVSVRYETVEQTALDGGYDYVARSGTLDFAPGETTRTVRIPISEYQRAEGTESFLFKLSGATNAALIDDSGTITIIDDDSGFRLLSFGLSDDDYYITDATDQIVEGPNGGTDRVHSPLSHVLEEHLENLRLTGSGAINGTGNAAANVLEGNGAANVLDGKGGVDEMRGGGGDDTYYIDNTGDVVIELGGGGTDTVISTVSRTLGDHQENLTLAGSGAIKGTGNALANVLEGNAAANMLDGKAGADKMSGGRGNDTYRVDNTGDVVIELGGGGTDTVISTVSRTLGDHQENLTLAGSGAIKGTGNALANVLEGNVAANTLSGAGGADKLYGNAGNDLLIGGAGNDVLYGGSGRDAFRLDSELGSGAVQNLDRIMDFKPIDDTIQLDDAIFTRLGVGAAGTIDAAHFRANASGRAVDQDDFILYETDTGRLLYDADGSGSGAEIEIAILGVDLALTHMDFVLV